ncbi:redoxin family protein [Candidatus Pacearchaeota archaeon]|nr:redoxin family protein [Candidatus Pacearchaeota archaeon]
MKNKTSIWKWIVLGIIVVSGLFVLSINLKQSESLTTKDELSSMHWINAELKDVRTGENFKISDFNGKKVLLESFAVWCPTCTKQQIEIKKLHSEVGDSIVSISLDMDPNEDESKILKHIEENGFEWYYAVSPIEMTQLLIDEFGNSIINAPSAPMVLICENGN